MGMDVDDLCAGIGGDCSLTLSPISRVSSDLSDPAVSPEVAVGRQLIRIGAGGGLRTIVPAVGEQ